MTDRERYVAAARDRLGAAEGTPAHRAIVDLYNSHKPLARSYALKYSDDWCAAFVSAMSIQCKLTHIIPTEVGCGQMVQLFQRLGAWEELDSYCPNSGDIIFYDWQDSGRGDNSGWPDHVGIVESCSDGIITLIEGNRNNSVSRRVIPVDSRYIRGYGVPSYGDEPAADPPKPEPNGEGKPLYTVANEVILGRWGNGENRRRRLSAAGYDPDAVQKVVNSIYKRQAIERTAREVIRGSWGNGSERKRRLEAAGYDYAEIQRAVNNGGKAVL